MHKNPEIKFRAWDTEEKKMIYEETATGGFPCFSEFINMLLLQYIGLKDRNYKDIFEGDILEGRYHGQGGYWYQIAIVIRDKYCFKLITPDGEKIGFDHPKFNTTNSRKVIGNIYENPELIKGGKK